MSTADAGAKELRLEYRVAKLASEQGVDTTPHGGDECLRYDRQELVGLARYMYDQNMVYAAAITRIVNNLLGANGFGLQARARRDDGKLDKDTNDLIEKELWPEFAAHPEIRNLYDWDEMEQIVAQDMINVGDFAALKLRNGQLQGIESERINTPSNREGLREGHVIEQGIELNRAGAPVAFHIMQPTEYLPNGWPRAWGKADRRLAKRIIYTTAQPQRYSRTRPAPPFVSAMSSIWRLEDILDSEAIAWQHLARFALAMSWNTAGEDMYDNSEVDNTASTTTQELTARVTEMRQGLIFSGPQGAKLEGVQRNLPGKDFPESVRMFLRLIGMLLGLPIEVLLLDWSNTNFSSGRAALTQATISIRRWQAQLVRKWHNPVYQWKIRQWQAAGRIPEGAMMGNAEWFPPAVPWVDPKAEGEAWGLRIDRGLVLYGDALKMQGQDRQEHIDKREVEILDAIAKSDAIFKAMGVVVPWQHFTGDLVGKTESAELAAGATKEGAEEQQDEGSLLKRLLKKVRSIQGDA
jgi:lambda family phage portal protein